MAARDLKQVPGTNKYPRASRVAVAVTADARANGATDADIQNFRTNVQSAPENIRNAINDPANREQIERNATQAAWYTFLGTLLSMAAAAIGGWIGAGPTFRLLTIRVPGTAA